MVGGEHDNLQSSQEYDDWAKTSEPYQRLFGEYQTLELAHAQLLEEHKALHQEASRLRIEKNVYQAKILEDHLPQVINDTIQKREGLKETPFVYYGLRTHHVLFTPATLPYFDIDELPEHVPLVTLMSHIARKNNKGEDVYRQLVTALRDEKHVRGLEAVTRSEKEIHLTTTPYYYRRGKHKKTVGVGISFNNPYPGQELLKTAIGIGTGKIHKAIRKNIQEIAEDLQRRYNLERQL